MNSINLYEPLSTPEPASEPALATPSAAGMPGHVLRQTGQRPVAFNGQLLAAATGWSTQGALWHELNLFATQDGRYVADIRVFKKSEDDHDVFRVSFCDSVDEALAVFESYDPRHDLSVGFDPSDESLSAAELVVHAAFLKAQIAAAQQQYQSVLGQLLHSAAAGR